MSLRSCRLYACVLVLLTQLCTPVFAKEPINTLPESVGVSSTRLLRLDTVLHQYVQNQQIAGSVAFVARRGKVVYHKAFGMQDMATHKPMQQDSLFRIASQTKAIVAVGVLLLQEQGKLLISDPVGKYLPAFKTTTVAVPHADGGGYEIVPADRPITIRDLLTHTSGIGYGGAADVAADLWKQASIQGFYFANRQTPMIEVVNKMATLPFNAQPGTQFIYGYNYDILGALIEVVSGQTLAKFLKHKIFAPLAMEHTFFYVPKSKQTALTVVYQPDENGLVKIAPQTGENGQGAYANGPQACYSGGAGLVSTAGDYGRFLQMLLDGGILDGQRILSPSTIALMTVNHLGEIQYPWDAGAGFGLGFRVVTDLGAYAKPAGEGTYGWGGAYHSVYWVDPVNELVAVYMTQLRPSNGLDDEEKFRTMVYQALIE